MKNIFAIAIPLVFLVACNSVEKHRAGIETLATQWDETTNAVTEFAGSLQTEQANFTQSLASMQVAEDVVAKIKDAAKKEAITAGFAALQNAGGAYNSINAEVMNFVSGWTEKAAEVNALKEGLANGKLEGDVAAQIASLTSMVTEANTKLEGWKQSAETARKAIANQQAPYQALVAEFMPQN